jgi:hypothetical protein
MDDGRVVEGRATLFPHHREIGRVQIPAGWASHGCCVVVFVLCRPERRKENRRCYYKKRHSIEAGFIYDYGYFYQLKVVAITGSKLCS